MSGGTAPLVVSPSGAPPAPASNSVRLFEVIGRGGMGEVHRAEQLELARQVAFKQLLAGSTVRQRERFAREARLTAQLDHPNIVPVHSLELARDGSPNGYVMKLVEGKTLRTLLVETAELYEKGQAIDAAHALRTHLEHFLKICDAVAFAHDRGVLHRDLKPPNIMIGKFGEVYVMDWGVARAMGHDDPLDGADVQAASPSVEPELTQAGEVVGSASYMSPEQAEGRNAELDARADQYSLGLILFEMLTLRRALTGASNDEVVLAASQGDKGPFEHVSPQVRIPPELRAIVEKATAFAPKGRYLSVTALADDVRRYLAGEAVLAHREGALGKVLRWIGRHRRTTLLAFAAVLTLSALVTSWVLYRETARELAARERGERITTFSMEASAQAHRIDAEFQRMEEALEGLRTASEWALRSPEPSGPDGLLYFDSDFANPAKRPADFTSETRYRWPVSVEFPVAGIAPSTNRAAILPKLRRIAPLQRHLRSMIVDAGRDSDQPLSLEQERALLLARKSPIDYAYVNLAEGVIFLYPGMDSLPPGYDVRTASFYKMSENKRGKRWGSPYVDSTTDELGDDLVLPCTAGMWSPNDEFLGVVGVEITVTKLVETSLVLSSRSTLRSSIVDANGKKIVDSFDAGKRFKASGKDESIELAEFDLPEVVKAIREGAEGVREVKREGRKEVVAFTRLSVLGWYYVVEIDAGSIAASPK